MSEQSTNGFYFLLEGFKLLMTPGVKRFVIIPLILNIILFCALFWFARHFFAEFADWLSHALPAWLNWLLHFIWLSFYISMFLIFNFTFVALANVVCAPFNSFLAEKIAFKLTGVAPKTKTFKENLRDIPHILARQFNLIGYYLPRALVLFIFFFVPVIQLVAAIFWFGFNAWFMTLQYLDYPTDNQGIPLERLHIWLWAHKLLSLSFGSGVLIVTMVPDLDFLIVPAAVAGATQLWLEKGYVSNTISN